MLITASMHRYANTAAYKNVKQQVYFNCSFKPLNYFYYVIQKIPVKCKI